MSVLGQRILTFYENGSILKMLGSQKGCPFLFPASAKGQGSGHVFLKVVHRREKESSAERNTARKNPNKKSALFGANEYK